MSERILHNDYRRIALGDKVDKVLGLSSEAYKRWPLASKLIAQQIETKKRMVEIVNHSQLPYAGDIAEAGVRTSNKMQQLWVTQLYMQYYQSNFVLSRQLIMHVIDNNAMLKKVLKGSAEQATAIAMKIDKAFFDMLNDYDDTTQVYGDALTIGSTAQLAGDGSTYSNLAAASADVTLTAIEDARNVVSAWVDAGGKAIMPKLKALVANPALFFDAQRILESDLEPSNDLNATNIVKSQKILPGGLIESPHFSNDGSFMLLTDVEEGFMTFKHPQGLIFDERPMPDRSWDVEMAALAACVHGIGDKRAVYIYPRD
jgi:hypothetical protein